jgi:hypothetical protein
LPVDVTYEEEGARAEGLRDEIVQLPRADGDDGFARERTQLLRGLDRGVLPREMENQLAFPMRVKIERAIPPSGFALFLTSFTSWKGFARAASAGGRLRLCASSSGRATLARPERYGLNQS